MKSCDEIMTVCGESQQQLDEAVVELLPQHFLSFDRCTEACWGQQGFARIHLLLLILGILKGSSKSKTHILTSLCALETNPILGGIRVSF